jgi:hypothetical protein
MSTAARIRKVALRTGSSRRWETGSGTVAPSGWLGAELRPCPGIARSTKCGT